MCTQRQQQRNKSAKGGVSLTNVENYCALIKCVIRTITKTNRTKLKFQKETEEHIYGMKTVGISNKWGKLDFLKKMLGMTTPKVEFSLPPELLNWRTKRDTNEFCSPGPLKLRMNYFIVC